jgi:hypothetical protein
VKKEKEKREKDKPPRAVTLQRHEEMGMQRPTL